MTYDDGILCCKSSERMWQVECSGAKPNTLRFVQDNELLALGQCKVIKITNVDTGETFTRDISAMFDITDDLRKTGWRGVYARKLVCICWEVES